MPAKLNEKIALVTGGSAGMGLATAELFVAEGALVYITGRRREPLDAATERIGPRLRGVVADASSLDDIERLFSTIRSEAGRLDVLFANAGVGNLTEPFAEVTPDSFDQLFGLNVRGTVFTAQKAADLMTSGGSIILTGSAAAEKAMPGSSVYAASKAALKAFARVWSAELAPRGIRVNVLHPGPTGGLNLMRQMLHPLAGRELRTGEVRFQGGSWGLRRVADDGAVDVDADRPVGLGLAGGWVDTGQQVGTAGGQVQDRVLVDLSLVEPLLNCLRSPKAELRVPQRTVGVGVTGIGQGGEVPEHVEDVAAVAEGVDERRVGLYGVLGNRTVERQVLKALSL
jgi:NAD(P)-dependent dehydrogenase (short-subunit alcohol dehydrogenase family)